MSARLESISPFFIVADVPPTLAFYRDRLGFEVAFLAPPEEPFFAIVRREGAQLLLKAPADIPPLPNWKRHPWAPWDAFVYVPDPDELSAEFSARGVAFRTPLADTDDNLRGFEVEDPDGHVLFFGRPR
jgi:catechol 2,3-dioxygenase-like lactoylglutathione lyase family enzyme